MWRVFVMDAGWKGGTPTPMAMINPTIMAAERVPELAEEGCLSIPGLRGVVPRHQRIKVRARQPDGEAVSFTADGFHARVIQHELDHLDGIVFLDRMASPQSLAFEDEWLRYVIGEPVEGDE